MARGKPTTAAVYALLWPANRLAYVGASIDVRSRTRSHLKALAKGTHINPRVQAAYARYGEPLVKTLEVVSADPAGEWGWPLLERLAAAETGWVQRCRVGYGASGLLNGDRVPKPTDYHRTSDLVQVASVPACSPRT